MVAVVIAALLAVIFAAFLVAVAAGIRQVDRNGLTGQRLTFITVLARRVAGLYVRGAAQPSHPEDDQRCTADGRSR